MRPVQVLPLVGWLAIVAAASLDPEHDAVEHYISWLSDGEWAWLAVLGVLAMCASAAWTAWEAGQAMGPGWMRPATATLLGCAAVLGASTLVLPSRGVAEPLWRTATHVGLAVGAYAGIGGAALLLAWRARHGHAPRTMVAAAVVLVAAAAALLVAAAVARLGPWGTEVRGLAQLTLAGAAAVWLAVALGGSLGQGAKAKTA